MARTMPYTAIGIRRLACFRCGAGAQTQWQVCADGNQYRPLCWECDVALNMLVLSWMGDPEAAEKVAAYAGVRSAPPPGKPATPMYRP